MSNLKKHYRLVRYEKGEREGTVVWSGESKFEARRIRKEILASNGNPIYPAHIIHVN